MAVCFAADRSGLGLLWLCHTQNSSSHVCALPFETTRAVLRPARCFADRLWVRRLQVEAAWAAAAQVVISGAAGSSAAIAVFINGRFEQVDREVYRKVGEAGRWLFVAKSGFWHVSNTADKDARKTESRGLAHSVAPAGEMPPPAEAGRWQVADGKGGKWVEQTVEVEVLDAAQAREWAARQAEQVGALRRPPPPCCSPGALLTRGLPASAAGPAAEGRGGGREGQRGRRAQG